MLHSGIDTASMQHPGSATINHQAAYNDLLTRGGGREPFAIVKLTELGRNADGTTFSYVNPFAAKDVAAFKAAGFAAAGYHFVHGNTTAQEQIALILAHLDTVDFVWLDCEVSDGATPAAFDAMLSAIVAGVGPRVGIYDNQSFSAFIASGGFVSSLPLWFADPSNTDSSRPRAITQTGQGMVAGISVSVDLDTCEDASFNVLWPTATSATPTVIVDPVDPGAPTAEPTPIDPSPAPVVEPTPTEPTVAPAQGVNELLPVIGQNSADVIFVKRLQALLVADGSNTLTIDGIFGPITLREVLAFQHNNSLAADGIVGPLTWGKLLGI